MKIKVYKNLNIMFGVQFKKIEILIDCDSHVFLGNIKSDKIGISKRIGLILLRKFKIFNWDNCNENLAHIKFLAKYSPILSKFINFEEFNNIKIQRKDYKSIAWGDVYYIKFNNGLKFFNTEEVDFDTETLSININSKFSRILKSFEKYPEFNQEINNGCATSYLNYTLTCWIVNNVFCFYLKYMKLLLDSNDIPYRYKINNIINFISNTSVQDVNFCTENL